MIKQTGKKRKICLLAAIAAICVAFSLAFIPTATVSADEGTSVTNLLQFGDNLSVTTNVWYNYVGGSLESNAMIVTSTGGTGKVSSVKPVDLTKLSDSDYIFRWRPYAEGGKQQAVSEMTVKLTDAEDSDNYVVLTFIPNNNMTYYGDSAGANSYWTYKNTSGEYVTTGLVYEGGLFMGSVGSLAQQMGNNGGIEYDFDGDGNTDSPGFGGKEKNTGREIISYFSLAYSNGFFYTPRKQWNTNGDFVNWVGFSGTKVDIELAWTTVADGRGVAIDTVMGLDVSGTTVAKQTPIITVEDVFDVKPGTEVDIPAADIYCYTHTPETAVNVYLKNGTEWTDKSDLISDGKFTPTEEGLWKIVYTADTVKEETSFTVSKDLIDPVSLVTAGSGVSLTKCVEYTTERPQRYPGYDGGKGVQAISSTKTGKVMSKLIDLSTISGEDIFSWYPTDINVNEFVVTISDAKVAGNYVKITFTPNDNMKFNGAVYGSNSTVTYINNDGYEKTIGAFFEYGAVLGNWTELYTGLYTEGYLPIGLPDGEGVWHWADPDTNAAEFFAPFSVKYDYENGSFTTPKHTWNKDAMAGWKGFSSSEVYVELSWESSRSGSGALIKETAGVSAGSMWVSKNLPIIKPAAIENVSEGKQINLADASVYCYTHEVGLTYEVYFKDGGLWTDRSALVSGDKFSPNAVGEWKVVYVANDGSEVRESVTFTVSRKEFEVEDFEYEKVMFVGEQISLKELAVSNMIADEYEVEILISKDDTPVDALPAVLSERDIGEYLVTYEAVSNRGATYSVNKTFKVMAYPTIEDSYEITAGGNVGDIEFSGWGDATEYEKSVYLYLKGDATEAFVSPYNLSKGVYTLEITLSYVGRQKDVVLVTTLNVKAGSGDEEPSSEPEDESIESDSDSDKTSENIPPKTSEKSGNHGGGCLASAGAANPMAILSLFAFAAIIIFKKKAIKGNDKE